MLKIFIEDKTLFDGETRCQFLQKYFVKEGGLPKENIEVDVAKNHEQDLTNGKGFEYKKQIFELEKSSKENLKPMDWIALQWPGLKGSQAKPPSPWEYEYVVLHGPLNNKKADVRKMYLWHSRCISNPCRYGLGVTFSPTRNS
jgi:hypothetical protein